MTKAVGLAAILLIKINTIMIRFTQKFTFVFAIALTAFSCSTLPEDPRTWEGLYPQKKSNVKDNSLNKFSEINQPVQSGIIHNLEPEGREKQLSTTTK
jgi:hypothetical protein